MQRLLLLVDVVPFDITGCDVLGVVHFDAQVGQVVAFPAYSLVSVNNLVVVVWVYVQLVHWPVYLVPLERLEDFDLVVCHVKWLYLDLVIRVRADAVAPDIF